MYHAVTRSQWREKLDLMNEQKSAVVKSKIAQQKMETQHINSTLAGIQKEKDNATTPEQALEALKKEQGLLIHLHGNIQYPDHYNQSLLLSIQTAMKNKQDNTIDQLNKLSSFVQSKNFKTAEEMTKILQHSTDPREIHKNLLESYQDNFLKHVYKGLNMIENNQSVKIDNQRFECPIKFLEHVVKTRTSEYMPHHEMQQLQHEVFEQQKHMEMSFGGPNL